MIRFSPLSSLQANTSLRTLADPIDQNYGLRRPTSALWKVSILQVLLLIPLVLPKPMFAQSSLADVLGLPPDAAIYPIPGLGFVNLNSGNLHIEIPIRVVKDRNGVPLTTSITYDNSLWHSAEPGTKPGDRRDVPVGHGASPLACGYCQP
jgi:hypothetical protein